MSAILDTDMMYWYKRNIFIRLVGTGNICHPVITEWRVGELYPLLHLFVLHSKKAHEYKFPHPRQQSRDKDSLQSSCSVTLYGNGFIKSIGIMLEKNP